MFDERHIFREVSESIRQVRPVTDGFKRGLNKPVPPPPNFEIQVAYVYFIGLKSNKVPPQFVNGDDLSNFKKS